MKTKPFVFLPIILLLTCCSRHLAFYEPELQANDPRTTGAVQDVRWGYNGDQLLFVIFQTSINGESHTEGKITPIPAPKNADVYVPHYDHWIELPDGTRKDLPGSLTMFQYDLDGAFTSRPIDVTLDEFRGWIASRPQIYSIEKLEDFAARQQKQR